MSNFHCSEIGFISPTETLQSLALQRFIRMRYDDLNPHFLFYKLALLILFDRNNNCFSEVSLTFWGGLAQWVARLNRIVEVAGSSPIKGPRCFLEKETCTGWFQLK